MVGVSQGMVKCPLQMVKFLNFSEAQPEVQHVACFVHHPFLLGFPLLFFPESAGHFPEG